MGRAAPAARQTSHRPARERAGGPSGTCRRAPAWSVHGGGRRADHAVPGFHRRAGRPAGAATRGRQGRRHRPNEAVHPRRTSAAGRERTPRDAPATGRPSRIRTGPAPDPCRPPDPAARRPACRIVRRTADRTADRGADPTGSDPRTGMDRPCPGDDRGGGRGCPARRTRIMGSGRGPRRRRGRLARSPVRGECPDAAPGDTRRCRPRARARRHDGGPHVHALPAGIRSRAWPRPGRPRTGRPGQRPGGVRGTVHSEPGARRASAERAGHGAGQCHHDPAQRRLQQRPLRV